MFYPSQYYTTSYWLSIVTFALKRTV